MSEILGQEVRFAKARVVVIGCSLVLFEALVKFALDEGVYLALKSTGEGEGHWEIYCTTFAGVKM